MAKYCANCGVEKSYHSPANGCCWANAGQTAYKEMDSTNAQQQGFGNGTLQLLQGIGAQPFSTPPMYPVFSAEESLRQEVFSDMRMFPQIREFMEAILPEEFFLNTFPELKIA